MTSAPKKRKAEGRLKRFVQNTQPIDGQLPFVHITRAYSFDEMLEGETLEPSLCDVFGEQLIYLFYGRPAYRAKDGNNARLQFEWPIIFIFDPQKIGSIKRAFPFDTGAFQRQLYSEFFDKKSQMGDFELDPSLDGIKRFIGTFYQDHKEYYSGSTRKNVPIEHRQFEAEGILELSRLPGVQDSISRLGTRDERSSAVEVQLSHPLSLIDSLLAIVLPEPYMDDNQIKEALARWQVPQIETYTTLHNQGGEAWVGQIYGIVKDIYKRRGFLT